MFARVAAAAAVAVLLDDADDPISILAEHEDLWGGGGKTDRQTD